MKKEPIPFQIFRFYSEGFTEKTLASTLQSTIFMKLFIMNFILKLFYFCNFWRKFETKPEKQQNISDEIINCTIIP